MFFPFAAECNSQAEEATNIWKIETLLFGFFVSLLEDVGVSSDIDIDHELEEFIDGREKWPVNLLVSKKLFLEYVLPEKRHLYAYFHSNRTRGIKAFMQNPETILKAINDYPGISEHVRNSWELNSTQPSKRTSEPAPED